MHAECAHAQHVWMHVCMQTCKHTSTVKHIKCLHVNTNNHFSELLAVRCDEWTAVNAGVKAAAAHQMCWDQNNTHSEVAQGDMSLWAAMGADKSTDNKVKQITYSKGHDHISDKKIPGHNWYTLRLGPLDTRGLGPWGTSCPYGGWHPSRGVSGDN